jgi:hypothetical protein
MIVKTISDDPRKTTVVVTNEVRITEEDQHEAIKRAYEDFIKQHALFARYME